MKKELLFFFIMLIINVSALKAQNWTQLTPPYSYIINSCWIDETSPDNGWFVGWHGSDPVSYGYKTTDGGNSFIFFTFGYYFWLAQDVFFVDSNTGVAVGGGIAGTTDGNTWNIVVDNITLRGWMYDVMFTDATNGYSVGQTYDNSYTSYWGVLYQTFDGGNSWTNSIITYESDNQNTEFRAVHSTGGGIIYAGGLNTMGNNSLFKSDNNGITWSALGFYDDVNSIWFASADTGYIAGGQGIYKTTDAGLTWNTILTTTQALFSIGIKDEFGFAVGANGLIYNTTDRGLSWTLMTSPVDNQDLLRVFVVSNSLAYAVGTSGTIIKYEVIAGAPEEGLISSKEFMFLQNYPNPFKLTTKIEYDIPVSGMVNLKVYNVLGKEISALVNGKKPAGKYEVNFNMEEFPSGIYFYSLQTGGYTQTKKMIKLK